MPEHTVRLDLGFQGTRYEGWQSQKNQKTVQEELEKALLKIFPGKRTVVFGSSRTDSGVHALHFASHFKIDHALPDEKLRGALNYHLPDDIVIHKVRTVRDDFHCRYHARSKIYRYDLWNSRVRPLFEAPFVVWHPSDLSVTAMKQAAKRFLGKHDFRAFKDSGEESSNTIRTIKKISIQKKGPRIRITIEGDGFLTHMVRIIAGTLLEVGRGKKKPSDISTIIQSKNRRQAGPTAKPHGLCLVRVKY